MLMDVDNDGDIGQDELKAAVSYGMPELKRLPVVQKNANVDV